MKNHTKAAAAVSEILLQKINSKWGRRGPTFVNRKTLNAPRELFYSFSQSTQGTVLLQTTLKKFINMACLYNQTSRPNIMIDILASTNTGLKEFWCKILRPLILQSIKVKVI